MFRTQAQKLDEASKLAQLIWAAHVPPIGPMGSNRAQTPLITLDQYFNCNNSSRTSKGV